MLSRPTTSSPRSNNRLPRWAPIKPAIPVIMTFAMSYPPRRHRRHLGGTPYNTRGPSCRTDHPPARDPHRQAEPGGHGAQKGSRVAGSTTRARSADTAPGGRDVRASDYPVLKAGYSRGGKTRTSLHFPLPYCTEWPERTKGRQSPEKRCVAPAPILVGTTGRSLSDNRRAEKSGWCMSGAAAETISTEAGSSSSSPHWCIPEGPSHSPERPLPLEAPHEALGVLEELAHGGAKGGHRLTVGVGDPLVGGGAKGVLRQGVDPLREVPEAPAEGGDVPRAHPQHEVGLL